MIQRQRTSEVLAERVCEVRYDLLPEEVVRKAKELVLDSIACMVGGVGTVQGEKVLTVFFRMGGTPDARVVADGRRLPLLNAVYVNSYLATVLDFDDTYDGHPGSTVVPVALSIAETKDCSGKEFLEAVVAGYEVGIRVSNGIKPTPERTKRVRGINTWQIFCAAAVAARLLGLSRAKTRDALCHAAIHAPVPTLRKWGFIDGRIQWLKNNFGWTSYGGVLSAVLAEEGFVADTTIFDGEDGFWIMASSDRCDYDALRRPLDEYHILLVHTKPYPACRHIHPTLDAVLAIRDRYGIRPKDVEKIEVHTFYEVVRNYAFYPTVPFDGAFSAPYVISLLLHGVPPGPAWANEAHLANPSILHTARKVDLFEWDEANRLYPLVKRELISRVVIHTKDGRRLEHTTRIPKGDPRNPMDREDITRKLESTAQGLFSRERVQEIADTVNRLEELDSLSELMDLLVTEN